ncbi:hypothetical protein NJLHNGOC_05690 [Novacetimonas cocois]|uniref:Uncharacterized protein n=1 Tax=Novacetimonas cocois TaxID=1747507 RepID=A0A365YXL5_9PROT|nr:hypothetical protein NJLHNGOC_05690 [Novacetimonas cocois]
MKKGDTQKLLLFSSRSQRSPSPNAIPYKKARTCQAGPRFFMVRTFPAPAGAGKPRIPFSDGRRQPVPRQCRHGLRLRPCNDAPQAKSSA